MAHDPEPDYYEILGIAQDAPPEEITDAYRRLMRAVHPDANGSNGLFRLVKAAYDTLSDPASRTAYDARRAGAPPTAPAAEPRPEASETPPPGAGSAPGRGRGQGQAGDWEQDAAAAPSEECQEESSSVRVRPRFGAHWVVVAVIAAWTAVCLAVLFALWPSGCPRGVFLLLFLPVAAGPLLSSQPALRSKPLPWAVCVVLFAGTAALAATTAGGDARAFRGALACLSAAAAGLAAAPSVVRRGRELDRLVSRDSLDYQIFNLPGAGRVGAARETSRISAGHLERITGLTGARIVHGLTPPPRSGQDGCYVDHVLLRGNRLALVVARRLPGGESGVADAVESFRKLAPPGIRVRGFVAVLPDGDPSAPYPGVPAGRGEPFAGNLTQVSEQVGAWLAEADPVLHRRMFARLLPYIERPEPVR